MEMFTAATTPSEVGENGMSIGWICWCYENVGEFVPFLLKVGVICHIFIHFLVQMCRFHPIFFQAFTGKAACTSCHWHFATDDGDVSADNSLNHDPKPVAFPVHISCMSDIIQRRVLRHVVFVTLFGMENWALFASRFRFVGKCAILFVWQVDDTWRYLYLWILAPGIEPGLPSSEFNILPPTRLQCHLIN